MTFLQPAMLWALPLIALPIVIHLINQRRFQTVQWGAMRFLLIANRMSRGYARLRQWLILAARTIAVAGLIFAVSRPLASGWLGLAGGGRIDATIVVLDRSPSMTQIQASGLSKLETAVNQLTGVLELLETNRLVLIDSASNDLIEIDDPKQLPLLPQTQPVSVSADLPTLLQRTASFIMTNRPSRTEVWICSDLRRHDWQDESGRWDSMRRAFVEMPHPVKFHLLTYPSLAETNRTIRVTDVQRVGNDTDPRLVMSLRLESMASQGASESTDASVIPVRLELDGAISEFEVPLSSPVVEFNNHIVPLDVDQAKGWGRVSIPADECAADNEFYFAYGIPPVRHTLIVAERSEAVGPLEFAASVNPDPNVRCTTERIGADEVLAADWEKAGLVLWQAPLPKSDDPVTTLLTDFVDRGGRLILFPPSRPDTQSEWFGVRWGQWREHPQGRVGTWVADQGLLANTQSGAALPLHDLVVSRFCEIEGDFRTLATLDGGNVLVAQTDHDRGEMFFCATTVDARDSNLASNGVVLYAMIHRTLAAGASSLSDVQAIDAGDVDPESAQQWRKLAGDAEAMSSAYPLYAGVYADDGKLIAINRSANEDARLTVPADRIAKLFDQLDYDLVQESEGSDVSLIQEIWRLCLIGMMVALVIEAILCLPRRATTQTRDLRVTP